MINDQNGQCQKPKYSNVFYDLKNYGLVDKDERIDSESSGGDKDFVF